MRPRRRLNPSLNRPVPPGEPSSSSGDAEYQVKSYWTVAPAWNENFLSAVWKMTPLFQLISNFGFAGSAAAPDAGAGEAPVAVPPPGGAMGAVWTPGVPGDTGTGIGLTPGGTPVCA